MFLPSRDWQYSNSHKLEAHSHSQYTVYDRGPRGKANAQRFFSLVGQMPSCSCAVESVLREHCPVTRSPSCERLQKQTSKPLPPPTCVVTSSTYVLWRRHSLKRRQKDRTNERSGHCHFGTTCPGSFREVRTHARDHLGELHREKVWAIMCYNCLRHSLFENVNKYCFIPVGEFCLFWTTVLLSVQILFHHCWERVEKFCFFFLLASRSTYKGCLQHVLSRVRSVIYFLHRCVRCSTFFHHDTRLLRWINRLGLASFNLALPGTVRL